MIAEATRFKTSVKNLFTIIKGMKNWYYYSKNYKNKVFIVGVFNILFRYISIKNVIL